MRGSRHLKSGGDVSAWLSETLKATEWLTNGDRVVVIGHESSRFLHNGAAYGMDWVQVNTVRDGKIVEMWEYNDRAAMRVAFRCPNTD